MDWEQLLNEHGRALLLYARQWVNSQANAEDALQEGFVRVFTRKPEADDVLPLLYQAVKWAALDQVRSRQRRRLREESTAVDEEQVAWFESGVEEQERTQKIEQELQKLPDEQREVLVMKVWGELTFRQIAETLDIPVGTVASRYRYGLETLRSQIDPEVWYE